MCTCQYYYTCSRWPQMTGRSVEANLKSWLSIIFLACCSINRTSTNLLGQHCAGKSQWLDNPALWILAGTDLVLHTGRIDKILGSKPGIATITFKPSTSPLGFAVGVDRVLCVPFWIQSDKGEPHESIGCLNKGMDKHVAQAMGRISIFCRPPLHISRYPPACLPPQTWCSKITNLVQQLWHV